MKKLLVSVANLLVFLQVNPALACSCLPRTPQETLASAQVVFTGRAIEIVSLSSAPQTLVRFEVLKVWKGGKKRQFLVTTSNSSASCGYSFQKGEEYLVYATRESSKLSTGLCSGTKPLATAQSDLTILGEGKKP